MEFLIDVPPEVLLFLSAIAAPIVAQLIKLLAQWKNVKLGRRPITWIAFIVSLLAAFYVVRPALPDFGADPYEIVAQVLVIATAINGAGIILYNTFANAVFALIPWLDHNNH